MGRVAVTVETKAVVEAHAVNRQAVVAWVGAITLHRVYITARLIHVQTRILLDDVVDVSVHGGRVLQGRQIKHRVGPHRGIYRDARAHHNHFFLSIEPVVDHLRLTHRQRQGSRGGFLPTVGVNDDVI